MLNFTKFLGLRCDSDKKNIKQHICNLSRVAQISRIPAWMVSFAEQLIKQVRIIHTCMLCYFTKFLGLRCDSDKKNITAIYRAA